MTRPHFPYGIVVAIGIVAFLPVAAADTTIIRTFVNGTATDLAKPEIRDLHIEYTQSLSEAGSLGSGGAIGPGSIMVNGNRVDVTFTRPLRPGESISIRATAGASKLGIRRWWWTTGNGQKATRTFRFTDARDRTRTARISDYGPEHRGDEPFLPAPKEDLHTIKNKSHHWGGDDRDENPIKITMDIRPLIANPPGNLDADKLKDNIKKAILQWTDCTQLNKKSRVPKSGMNGNPKNHGHQYARDPAVMAPGPTHMGAKGEKFRSVTTRECDAAYWKYPKGLTVNFIEQANDQRVPDIRTAWGVPRRFGKALGAGPTEHDRRDRDKTTRGAVYMRNDVSWHLAMDTNGDGYITNADGGDVPDEEYDFYSIFKHEFGHVLCLHHSGVNFTEPSLPQFGNPQPSGNGTATPGGDCCPHGHTHDDGDERQGSTQQTPDSYFFASNREGGQGGFDLWISAPDDEGQWVPQNLGPQINSAADEWDPFLAGDGTWLLFASNRPGGQGNFDIWESVYDDELQQWGPPSPVDEVNSPGNDRHPTLPTDQRTLFFHSDRPGGYGGADIWTSELVEGVGFVEPTNLGELVNSPFNDGEPAISGDGLLLWFVSDRPGGFGGFDIWLSVLTPEGWQQPGNVAEMNSQFQEFQPSVPSSNEMLLFASDRPGGQGNLDVYQAPLVAVPPRPISLYGTAQGGGLDILIDANGMTKALCGLFVPTVAGEDAATVAANVAAALEENACLAGAGVRIALQDNHVLLASPGLTPDDVMVTIVDPGLADAPAPGGPPGSLPPTAPITLDRGSAPGDVRIAWPPSCSTEAIDYGIYEGDLQLLHRSGVYGHVFVDCLDDDADRVENVTPQNAASYFLVVPNDLAVEGGYGVDSTGVPRPRGDTVCVPEQNATCPDVARVSERSSPR